MKRTVRLYNILLPIWLLWIFPQVWLIVLPGNLAIALGGYGTGATAQSCLARLVPLTKQILFYPTEASDHGIISPVCAFFVVYDTIHPDSPPSI